MIHRIAQSLYSDFPEELLYHYTTIKGLQGIVESRCLWASDVRYMNDSAELHYIVKLLRQRIQQLEPNSAFLNQFSDWIANRVTNGHMVFAASFRANGNLLSQWRGYSSVGKGVSIGFSGRDIQNLSVLSQFQLGRCIYQKEKQIEIIDRVVDSLLTLSEKKHLDADKKICESVFNEVEADMLRIAALFKHPSFAEEDEWRIVSPVVTDYLSAPVKFRESTAMLIPYYQFPLVSDGEIPVKHVFLGPTPNASLSLNSIRLYLRKNNILLENDISYCDIPYRNK